MKKYLHFIAGSGCYLGVVATDSISNKLSNISFGSKKLEDVSLLLYRQGVRHLKTAEGMID